MTVNGTLDFNSASTYAVNVNPTSSSANVTGTATLGGTVNANFAAGSYVARQYTILPPPASRHLRRAHDNKSAVEFYRLTGLRRDAAYIDMALNYQTPVRAA